ncbi:hypothetical protein ACFFV7_35640 [Nonomuraea spiralis]|uniref:Signal transduction histidine kinase subgroup 3 dimerisation and phosphoacceptor domain-containing protein n=1 Tax=Nonomuraea spiralis TaxID=46182 RepID=A0ABV5IPY2_9ACTN|nr:hypothetical protein [Nonomuraea spiralis]
MSTPTTPARVRRLLARLYGACVRGWRPAGGPEALGRRLQEAISSTGPQAALAAVVELVREGLPADGVAVEVAGSRITAGDPRTAVHDVPLTWHGRTVGRLLIGPPADPRTLDAITPYVADAAHAVAVAADLRRTRERVLAIRDEERRRLHRDLHEGLGTALRDLAGTVDRATSGLRTDPAVADRLLRDLSAAMDTIGQEIRAMLQDPHPPARVPRPRPSSTADMACIATSRIPISTLPGES